MPVRCRTMLVCPSCKREIPDPGCFCPACGAALPAGISDPAPGATAPTIDSPQERASSSVHGNFEPGTRLGTRYRIVGLLGRGGMGEVYRADDLELNQSVALKFLPEQVSRNPADLARLRQDVRVARQIAHPNVYRTYDTSEAGGLLFVVMEYVDGEDLASVLRRLGRPTPGKAVEIARQLCLGLGAAHEAGVIHCDLKPANIMIDGRGRVRITDFGVAGTVEELAAEGRASGPSSARLPSAPHRRKPPDLGAAGYARHRASASARIPEAQVRDHGVVIGRKDASDARSGDSHPIDGTRGADENVIQPRARQAQAPMERAALRSRSRRGPWVLEGARGRGPRSGQGSQQGTGRKRVEVSGEDLRAAPVIVEQPEQTIRCAARPGADQAQVRAEDVRLRFGGKPDPDPVHDVGRRGIALGQEGSAIDGSAEASPHQDRAVLSALEEVPENEAPEERARARPSRERRPAAQRSREDLIFGQVVR
jgi:hypothetical protein